jgi:2-methylfumaryl-CoA isomerase
MTTLPLSGLRIIDTTTFIAGPSGTMALGQLGADVIRVDPLGGASDSGRLPLARNGRSLYWASLNKGKRSLSIDTRSIEGRQLLVDVITSPGNGGGIYVTNAVGRSLVSYEELSAIRPDLIMIHIQGMPDGGPAVDYTVSAGIGMASVTRSDSETLGVSQTVPTWDLLCGLHAALAVVVAERQRQLTGVGQLVEIALWDVAIAAIGNLGMLAEVQASVSPERVADGFIYGTFGTTFSAADGGSVLVVALTPRMWQDLVEVTDTTDDLAHLEADLDVDFRDEATRFEHRVELARILQGWFSARHLNAIEHALAETRIQWSVVRSVRSLVADLKKDMPDVIGTVNEPGMEAMLATKSPMRFSSAHRQNPAASPVLGQHTAQLLVELLHLDDKTIQDLAKRRIISA